jgi:hypothetical protein
MRYLTSISLALVVHVLLSIVVLMALACTATPTPTPTPTPIPRFSDVEVIGAIKQHLRATGHPWCFGISGQSDSLFDVRRDSSNPDRYFVTAPAVEETASWTFIGSLVRVIPTPKLNSYLATIGC